MTEQSWRATRLRWRWHALTVSCLLLLAFSGGGARAQALDEDGLSARAKGDPEAPKAEEDEPKIVLLPLAGYSPESSVAFAALAMIFFESGGARPASSNIALAYTLRNQSQVNLGVTLPLARDLFRIRGNIRGLVWNDRFYGVGNDTGDDWTQFDTEAFETLLDLMVRLGVDGLYGGVILDAQWLEVTADADSLLMTSGVVGRKGGARIGAGALLQWDSREGNVSAPSGGQLASARYTLYDKQVAGGFTYRRLQLDARHYQLLGDLGLLAIRLRGDFTDGEVPFDELSVLGGDFGRGIYQGRYRDRHAVSSQLEWRSPLWKSMGGVVFGSVGAVAPDVATLAEQDPRWTAGAGFRYFVAEEEGVAVRVDVGFNDTESNVYISLGEAF